MKVFFDASVIIAALLSPTGGSSLLLAYIQQKKIIGITSQTVLDEIFEEDKPAKINKSRERIEKFIAESALLISERIPLEEIEKLQNLIDLEDAHLIAGARLTHCDYLVTLDKKHVLRKDMQQKFSPLGIVNPKELLEEIIAEM